MESANKQANDSEDEEEEVEVSETEEEKRLKGLSPLRIVL